MITIPEVVSDIIHKKPFIEEALSQHLLNLSSLARKIKPHIEEVLYKKVQTGAIVMALKRFKTRNIRFSSPTDVFHNPPALIARSNLIEFTIKNSDSLLYCITNIFSGKNTSVQNQFFTFTLGVFETSLICSVETKQLVLSGLKKESIIGQIKNLSAITIVLPKSNVTTPGVYYYILKSLAWESINVIDVVSTENEFTIIFEDADINRAFSILKHTLR